MKNRRGEKLGWTFGLLGGTVWMFVLAASGLFGGNWRFGVVALVGGCCVVGLVIRLAPWKHPTTQFWKLFVPPLALMILTAGVLLSGWGHGLSLVDWTPGLLLIVFPLLIPDIRARRWEDGDACKKVIPAREI